MIVGKYSALKGFGLFFYVIVTLMTLICICAFCGGWWCIIGVLNTMINTCVIVLIYNYWSRKSRGKI